MSEISKTRNSSIDLLKIIFVLGIALCHFSAHNSADLLPGGYIFIEGFFMITGYFMMKSVNRSEETDLGKDTLNFIRHKYLSFAPVLLASAIILTVVTIFLYHPTVKGIIANLVTLTSEIVPLQMAGIKGNATTAVAWSLSAMMLTLFILYPVARRTGTKFTRIICPILAVFIYGIICVRKGNLNTINNNLFVIPIQSGFFRGVAGICTGCMLYDCVKSTEKYKTTIFGEICFFGAEVASLAAIVVFAQFVPNSYYDFYTLPFFFILLYSCFGRKSVFSKNFSFKFTKHLSTASLIIYLVHNSWNYHRELFDHPELQKKFILYIVMIIGSGTAVALLTPALRFIWRISKGFLKKHFVGKQNT